MTNSTEIQQPGIANFFEHIFKSPRDDKDKRETSIAVGIDITWQNGIIDKDNPQNGAIIEDVIQCAIARLEYHQEGSCPSDFNKAAIENLNLAISCLKVRTEDRILRNVLNTEEI